MQLQLLTVFVSLLVSGPLQIHGQCPAGDQAIQQITGCISEFQNLTDFTKGPILASKLNNYCSSSARTTEIQCAENIIDECKQASPMTRELLDKTFNINATRGLVKLMCSSTNTLLEKQDCIIQQQSSTETCIKKAEGLYQSKLQSLQVEVQARGIEWFTGKAYEESCVYFNQIAVCFRPYGINCGREIGDLFDAQLLTVMPPVCIENSTLSTRQPVGSDTTDRNPSVGFGVIPCANSILFLTSTFVAMIVKGIL